MNKMVFVLDDIWDVRREKFSKMKQHFFLSLFSEEHGLRKSVLLRSFKGIFLLLSSDILTHNTPNKPPSFMPTSIHNASSHGSVIFSFSNWLCVSSQSETSHNSLAYSTIRKSTIAIMHPLSAAPQGYFGSPGEGL